MGEVAVRLHEVLDELAAENVSAGSLRDELLALDRARARLDAEVARRLRAFDRSCEWASSGARSAAGFLVAQTRCAQGEAYRRVRTAREVDALDATAVAWQTGAVTTSHVEAVTRARHAAQADDAFAEFEPALLDVACAGSPEDVARIARQWRDALDNDRDRDGAQATTAAEQERDRHRVDFSRSIDGLGFGSFTLEPLGAEYFETALRRAYDDLHVAGDPRSPAQQRADALVEICRSYLENRPRGANLPSVLLVTDVATLTGDAVGECSLAGGARVSPDAARRIACDALVQQLLVDGAGVPLAMGRATRTFTADQYRAMVVRDAHCRGPDCQADPARCDAHHLDEWWRDDGPTDLANGVLFCRGHCHRMLHEGGWTVTGDPNGELVFHDRDGCLLGSSFPHQRAAPILTEQGKRRARTHRRIRARAHALISRRVLPNASTRLDVSV